MGQIRIKYDPYWQQLEYSWRNAENSEWEPLNDTSTLRNGDKYEKGSLQSILPRMLPIIDKQYNYGKNDPLHIVFCGTDEDFDDFQYAFLRIIQPIPLARRSRFLKRTRNMNIPLLTAPFRSWKRFFPLLNRRSTGRIKKFKSL